MALWSLIEINYFFTPYFSLMGFCCVSWRSLRPVGLLALKSLKLLLRQLPTGAASRKKGSSTVGASLFLLVVLSSKIWAFWGCYGGRGRNCGVGACRWGGAVVRQRRRALASLLIRRVRASSCARCCLALPLIKERRARRGASFARV